MLKKHRRTCEDHRVEEPDLKIKDVRVRKVWLASGQSNMQ